MFLRSVICSILVAATLISGPSIASSGGFVPPNALKVIPILKKVQVKYWPTNPNPVYLAGQTEQESCVSLKSKLCWSPKSELKTSYEYGFGLYQITITKKFNNFLEARKLDPALKDWKWEDRYDPAKQSIYFIKTMNINFERYRGAVNSEDQYAFAQAAYNGGIGGVNSSIMKCKKTVGCNPTKWFENVEGTSNLSKGAKPGYGQSNFCINRTYPRKIMFIRSEKYLPYFNGSHIKVAPPVPRDLKTFKCM